MQRLAAPAPTEPAGRPRSGCQNRPTPHARPRGRQSRSRPASQVTNRRYGDGRGQPLPVIAGEYFPQQDRQRPAIQHDVVIGQHKPVPILARCGSTPPETAGWSARSQTAARSAAHTCWICSSTSTSSGVQLDIPPRRHRISRDDLHRLVELCAESGRQVRMPVDHRVHRLAQPVRIERHRST